MTKKNLLKIISLILLVYMLIAVLSLYKNKQNKIYLEANNLYTKNALKTSGNYSKMLDENSINSKVFKVLSEENHIRALEFKGNRSDFPVYVGRNFKKDERKALVGSTVPLEEHHGVKYFSYNEKLYEVIGYLGSSKDSILSDEVIIKDESLFSKNKNENIIIDSPDSVNVSAPNYKVSNNLGRRSNIDYITPLITYMVVLSIGFISLIIGVLSWLYSKTYAEVMFLKGKSPKKIRIVLLFKVLLVFLVTNVFCIVLSKLFVKSSIELYLLLPSMLIIIIGLVTSSHLLKRGIK
ncbi:hypothetical protein [Lactococcus ileimucosae]|uniref:hypothetical protein n=1 Tax=Lactococcus ileimucosae TaxID=2941329 RepID=UPI002042F4A2|nr:hypothetical protein [Lactococcus ileimucosae]